MGGLRRPRRDTSSVWRAPVEGGAGIDEELGVGDGGIDAAYQPLNNSSPPREATSLVMILQASPPMGRSREVEESG